MILTRAELDNLKRLASEATQITSINHPKMEHFKDYLIGEDCCPEEPFVMAEFNRHMSNWKLDLHFYAAANPQVITALVTRLIEAEEALQLCRNLVRDVQTPGNLIAIAIEDTGRAYFQKHEVSE